MVMKRGERVFVDTNVLLEASDEGRRWQREASGLFEHGPDHGIELCLSGQVLREYLVVATRGREHNGLGLAVEDALHNVGQFRARATLCPETTQVSSRLLELIASLGTTGKKIHDLNIAATAMVAGVEGIVTGNPKDFSGHPGLRILPLGDVTLP
jgi:predicted nucleic acid-binding protein